MGEITAVVSAKGGTGVTTVTAGIGSALARRGQKTLLLDLNFMKGDLPVLFGAEQRIAWHLLDVIEGNCRIIQALIPCRKDEMLYILPASLTRELRQIQRSSFVKLCEMLRASFDCILIDTPSGICDGLLYALSASDSAVLVTDSTLLSRRDTKRILTHPDFSSVHKCVLLNRFQKKLVRDGGMPSPEEISTEIGEPLLGIIPESEEILSAEEQESVPEDGRSQAARCFDRISGRLLGEEIPINLKR